MATLFINGREVQDSYWQAHMQSVKFLDDVVVTYAGDQMTVIGHPRPNGEFFDYKVTVSGKVIAQAQVDGRGTIVARVMYYRDVLEGRSA